MLVIPLFSCPTDSTEPRDTRTDDDNEDEEQSEEHDKVHGAAGLALGDEGGETLPAGAVPVNSGRGGWEWVVYLVRSEGALMRSVTGKPSR